MLWYMTAEDFNRWEYQRKFRKIKSGEPNEHFNDVKSLQRCEKWILREILHQYNDSKIFSTFFFGRKKYFSENEKYFSENAGKCCYRKFFPKEISKFSKSLKEFWHFRKIFFIFQKLYFFRPKKSWEIFRITISM